MNLYARHGGVVCRESPAGELTNFRPVCAFEPTLARRQTIIGQPPAARKRKLREKKTCI